MRVRWQTIINYFFFTRWYFENVLKSKIPRFWSPFIRRSRTIIFQLIALQIFPNFNRIRSSFELELRNTSISEITLYMFYIHFQNFATYSLYIFTDDKFIKTYSHEYTNIVNQARKSAAWYTRMYILSHTSSIQVYILERSDIITSLSRCTSTRSSNWTSSVRFWLQRIGLGATVQLRRFSAVCRADMDWGPIIYHRLTLSWAVEVLLPDSGVTHRLPLHRHPRTPTAALVLWAWLPVRLQV